MIVGEAAADESGSAVSLSEDGLTVAVGSFANDGAGTSAGHVRIFDYNGLQWVQRGTDIDGQSAGDYFSWSISLSNDGNTLVVGGRYSDNGGNKSGHAQVYDWDGTEWQLALNIDGDAAEDNLGRAATISGDGLTIAIGATGNDASAVDAGHVQVYRLQPLVSTATDTVRVEITPLNDAPTLDVLMNLNVSEDAAEQVVALSGISAGGGESQSIRVTAISSNTGLIPNPLISYVSPNVSGSLAFTPVADQYGTATITVTVEDGGLDGFLSTAEDNATTTQTFDVVVNAAVSYTHL
ncbi:MAG: Ig-like domain-containing protein, partial [Alphaproteobacteria bacterium]|nr:Ig-like domain-containing protein [Alphaproteobacteria bacterium]